MEVLVLGEDGRGSMLQAHGRDLRVEDEVASNVPFLDEPSKEREEPSTGEQDACARAGQKEVDRTHRLRTGRRASERSQLVRDNTEELPDREDRNAPGRGPFRELGESGSRALVLRRFGVIGVYEDVGVDGDQPRPSMRSYSASRSATSTSGGPPPSTTGKWKA